MKEYKIITKASDRNKTLKCSHGIIYIYICENKKTEEMNEMKWNETRRLRLRLPSIQSSHTTNFRGGRSRQSVVVLFFSEKSWWASRIIDSESYVCHLQWNCRHQPPGLDVRHLIKGNDGTTYHFDQVRRQWAESRRACACVAENWMTKTSCSWG